MSLMKQLAGGRGLNSSVLPFRCSPADLQSLSRLWASLAGIKRVRVGLIEVPFPQNLSFIAVFLGALDQSVLKHSLEDQSNECA